ncbi:MAG TPA: hypothetical protein VJN63_06470 [Thermoplasmata archaeon]|nr:hypothetical protein [Thermoplasmata archaeon]
MAKEGTQTEVLKLRIDPELLELVKEKARSLNLDVSTFVRWCIMTGLVLGDLNAFVHTRIGDKR